MDDAQALFLGLVQSAELHILDVEFGLEDTRVGPGRFGIAVDDGQSGEGLTDANLLGLAQGEGG